jgi:hypothetical protein
MTQCPGHIFKAGSQCQSFRWRDDLSPLPWGNVMSTPTKKKQAIPCTSPRCSSAPKPRGSHQKCSQGFCKECCLGTSAQCTVLTHNTPTSGPSSTASPALEALPARSFTKMIPPEYGLKIAQNVFTVSPSTRMQTEAYHMEAKHTITIKYWAEVHHTSISVSASLTTLLG